MDTKVRDNGVRLMTEKPIEILSTEELETEHLNLRDKTEWGEISNTDFIAKRNRLNDLWEEMRRREKKKIKPKTEYDRINELLGVEL